MARADQIREEHPGLPRRTFAFHSITNTWIDAGPSPPNQVTTPAVKWGARIIVASGAIKPRILTRQVWAVSPVSEGRPFGALNYSVLAVDLLGMVGVGVYFANKNKDTNDCFRGGQKILWWAAGCSIFATMLSSITYMAISAKAYRNAGSISDFANMSDGTWGKSHTESSAFSNGFCEASQPPCWRGGSPAVEAVATCGGPPAS
jgi:hypothetical protein